MNNASPDVLLPNGQTILLKRINLNYNTFQRIHCIIIHSFLVCSTKVDSSLIKVVKRESSDILNSNVLPASANG